VKKFFAISLAVVYLAISSGVVVNIHYCMGEVAEVALGHDTSDTCGKCGMENDGCCHDDVKVVKIQDAQSITGIPVDFVKSYAQVESFFIPDVITPFVSVSAPVEKANAPPGKGQVSLCIKNCVFRI
jgi:hypothetical protein